jgi:cytidine deaminase
VQLGYARGFDDGGWKLSNDIRTASWKDAVEQLPGHMRFEIDALWDNGGILHADVVQRIVEDAAEIGRLMMRLLPVAQQYAAVPVSHYQVGAVAAGTPTPNTGWCSLYLGANFEFSETALSFTIHAEQAAINNAWLSGERGVQSLAISAAPCGYCRQFLYELVTAKQLQILLPANQFSPVSYGSTPLTEFLPDPFGPSDLGIRGGLMDRALCERTLTLKDGDPNVELIEAALKAAERSYNPYLEDSGYAGVAVKLTGGKVYAGRVAANAAYNPSLSPLGSALAFVNMHQPPGSKQTVERCVLVEVPSLASQLSATRAALAGYGPGVNVEYYTATIAS